MIITELSPYKGTTWQLVTDSGEKIYIGQKTAEKLNLKKGMELPESAHDTVREEDIERKSRERALYLLAGRDYGFVELFRKLEKSYQRICAFAPARSWRKRGLLTTEGTHFGSAGSFSR